MCKEIKRLTALSECQHLNKTDRDAIIFILRETGNIKVEAENGFDGFDFSSWPNLPNKNIIRDWVKTRKSKGKSIITQTFIESCAKQLIVLVLVLHVAGCIFSLALNPAPFVSELSRSFTDYRIMVPSLLAGASIGGYLVLSA